MLTSDGGAIYFMQREKTQNVSCILAGNRRGFSKSHRLEKNTSAVPGMKRFGEYYQIIVFATKGKIPRVLNRLPTDSPPLTDYTISEK